MNVPVNEALENVDALREFLQRLIDDKRKNACDDMLSGLVHAETDPR